MMQEIIVCSIPICTTKQYGRALCKKHYQQARKNGMIYYFPKTKRRSYCKENGCSGLTVGRGWCSMHYTRFRESIPFDIPRRYKSKTGSCEVLGCIKEHAARGMCKMHLKRERDGNILEGPSRKNSDNWDYKDINWRKNSHGYLAGVFKRKMVLQHRVVWEMHNARKLQKFENIHHINGIRDDNRIENLQLWTKPQPSGQRPEDLVAWVVEHYPEQVLEAINNRA